MVPHFWPKATPCCYAYRMTFFLIALLHTLPAPAAPALLVGDSHMAGTLGDALVREIGADARRYGIVSASSEMTYTTGAKVPKICPNGCDAVCPKDAACPYTLGYRRPEDKQEMSGRVPSTFPRIRGLLEKEKAARAVVIELGTNEAGIYGCGKSGVTKMAALLDQVTESGRPCAYVGPPPYLAGSPIFARCGARYNEFVNDLLAMAREKGCLPIDSRQVKEADGSPLRCLEGGYHCTPAQGARWGAYVAHELAPLLHQPE